MPVAYLTIGTYILCKITSSISYEWHARIMERSTNNLAHLPGFPHNISRLIDQFAIPIGWFDMVIIRLLTIARKYKLLAMTIPIVKFNS